jgi:uncharacterized Fe-S center protein
MPVIMADGLMGDEETEVEIPGRLYRSVKIASLIAKVQALVVVSHFTGHLAAGFGAALKNMGMGCSSRRGKMAQHSTARPRIKVAECTKCGQCVKWCPEEAIGMSEESAVIDPAKCIGCGQCLAVCRFDAVAYNWGVTYIDLQRKVVEHAWGVHRLNEGKSLYINYLTRISKDCDCMTTFEQVVPDIGVVISRDPVALDAASLDCVENAREQNSRRSLTTYRTATRSSMRVRSGSATPITNSSRRNNRHRLLLYLILIVFGIERLERSHGEYEIGDQQYPERIP